MFFNAKIVSPLTVLIDFRYIWSSSFETKAKREVTLFCSEVNSAGYSKFNKSARKVLLTGRVYTNVIHWHILGHACLKNILRIIFSSVESNWFLRRSYITSLSDRLKNA